MKKMHLVVMLVFCMFGILKPSVLVKAANDDFTRATNISVNKVVTDKMASAVFADYNYYKFTLSSNGYINMSFSHVELESTSTMWNITLYDVNRNSMQYIESRGSEKNVTSNNIGLPAGTYYICVGNNDWGKKSTIDYRLLINYTASSNWETEGNGGFLTADNISVNQTIYGSMMYSSFSENDYYRFTLPSDGYINMSFSHVELESTSTMWKITLYDVNRNSITYIESRGSEKNVTSNNIGLPAGTYYICVGNNDWGKKSTIDYQLLINYTASSNWETEDNGGFLTADNLPINQTIYGSMMYSSGREYDYYKVNINKNGTLKVDFSHANTGLDSETWNIVIYDGTRKVITYKYVKGTETNVSVATYLSEGEYYICVENSRTTKVSTFDYALSCTYTTQKIKIKSVNSNTSKKISIKWNRIYDADGYQIVTATNKKFKKNKKVTTVKKSSTAKKTIGKLKKRKTYYVKMRGFTVVDGVTYYGPYSKVKKVKVR